MLNKYYPDGLTHDQYRLAYQRSTDANTSEADAAAYWQLVRQCHGQVYDKALATRALELLREVKPQAPLTIQIEIKSVYGELKAYPVNDAARCIANIAGTKTLTRATLLNVLAMGLNVAEMTRNGNVERFIQGGPNRRYGDLPRIA